MPAIRHQRCKPLRDFPRHVLADSFELFVEDRLHHPAEAVRFERLAVHGRQLDLVEFFLAVDKIFSSEVAAVVVLDHAEFLAISSVT
jgi:hypothetical protein